MGKMEGVQGKGGDPPCILARGARANRIQGDEIWKRPAGAVGEVLRGGLSRKFN